jgi:hypothetical protein
MRAKRWLTQFVNGVIELDFGNAVRLSILQMLTVGRDFC